MTKLKIMLYDHEFRNPVATSSLAYQELAKLTTELERELAEMPTHAYRIEQIVNQLQVEIPWLCLGMERSENE